MADNQARPDLAGWRVPHNAVFALVLLSGALAAWWVSRENMLNADLRALWMAGQMWEAERFDQIYPPEGPLFRLQPPESWLPWLAEKEGFEDWVFPFVYPPLWAGITSLFTGISFDAFASLVLGVNCALLAGSVWLGAKLMAGEDATFFLAAHAALAFLVLLGTPIGQLALQEGQPHILVSFLILLAIERSERGPAFVAAQSAGVALALAASIKLFPAGFALMWLGARKYLALKSFVMFGTALALISLLWAGWPLHARFLNTMSQISATTLLSGALVSFEAVLAQVFRPAGIEVVPFQTIDGPALDAVTGAEVTWAIAPRPQMFATAMGALMLVVLLGAALLSRRLGARARQTGVWPLAVTLIALCAPTGWIYYLIPAAVLAPGLIAQLGTRVGGALFLLGAAMMLLPYGTLGWLTAAPLPRGLTSLTGALIWCVGFALCMMKRED